jgi:dolichol-phosphate mannosyltransferase
VSGPVDERERGGVHSDGGDTPQAPAGGPVLSVVLPTFNEADNIGAMITRLRAALVGVPHELLVLDDRSPDGTAEVARATATEHAALRVIEREPPHGLTVSIRDGVERAQGRWVAWMDCDLSHPPELVTDLLAPLRAGEADVAIASRYVDGGADVRDPFTRLYSRVINGLAQLLVDRRVRDYTTGYVMAERAVVLDIGLRGDYGEYCIDLLGQAARRGLRIVEVPYRMKLREAGESKTVDGPVRFARRGMRYLATVARLAMHRGPAGS